MCRVKHSHVWGWLDPAANPDLMPVTYLKGAGAALGRGVEAFQAQNEKAACMATSAGRYKRSLLYHPLFHHTAVACQQLET